MARGLCRDGEDGVAGGCGCQAVITIEAMIAAGDRAGPMQSDGFAARRAASACLKLARPNMFGAASQLWNMVLASTDIYVHTVMGSGVVRWRSADNILRGSGRDRSASILRPINLIYYAELIHVTMALSKECIQVYSQIQSTRHNSVLF